MRAPAGHVFVISTLFSSPLLLIPPHQFCLSPQRKTQQTADRPHRQGRVGSSGGRLCKGEKSSGVFGREVTCDLTGERIRSRGKLRSVRFMPRGQTSSSRKQAPLTAQTCDPACLCARVCVCVCTSVCVCGGHEMRSLVQVHTVPSSRRRLGDSHFQTCVYIHIH